MRLLVSLLIACLVAPAAEILPEDRGAAGLWQALQRLKTTARVMHITAHPDDEDGGTLTRLSRGEGVDVTLLSLSRGEAGANLVTSDFFDALGALRTAELLRSAQYYGVDVRFTRAIDFGFSKNLAETFRNWDKEDVLRDVVHIIRKVRPHILMARFQGSPRDGHGNHEAAGVLAQLAFEAAGDPKRFPEQTAGGLPAWQPLKLYSNNRREGDDWTVRIDTGEYDSLLGRSYSQMAREGLRSQRSQGAGSAIAQAGPSYSYYKLLGSKVGDAAKEVSVFERTKLAIADRWPDIAKHIAAAVDAFDARKLSASAPSLASALTAARARLRSGADPDPDLEIEARQIEAALAQSLAIEVEALVEPASPPTGPFSQFMPYATFAAATPGQTFTVAVRMHSQAGSDVARGTVELLTPAGWKVDAVSEGKFRVTVPDPASHSGAYWSRASVQETSYQLSDPRQLGTPLPAPPLKARVNWSYRDTTASIEAPVETSYIDPAGVQRRRTLWSAPALSVAFASEAGVLPSGRRDYELTVSVRNYRPGPIEGKLRLDLPKGWTASPAEHVFRFEKEKEEAGFQFRIALPEVVREMEQVIKAVVVADGREFRAAYTGYTQPGLEAVFLAHPATHLMRVVDVKIADKLRIGYVMGTGDDVPAVLRQMGAQVDMLDAATLANGDLSKYETIALGIRAYAARVDVKTHNGRLLEYVKNGGVLVVQYNTQEYDNNFGPYPYTMTARAEEISEENAPVRVLVPDHRVFQHPNRITSADFDGWVEQRGSKFWTTWDPKYTALVESHDTDQPPQRGGWLIAEHGKGLYVYCAYAWYRQLPFAVPGAYRLVANLVSLGRR